MTMTHPDARFGESIDNHTKVRIGLGLEKKECKSCRYLAHGYCLYAERGSVPWPCYDGGQDGNYPASLNFVNGTVYWEPVE